MNTLDIALAGSRTGHQFTPLCNLMVLTCGMRDQGRLHNDVYLLNLDDGVWSKPPVQSSPPQRKAANANERLRDGVTPDGLPTPRTGHTCTALSQGLLLFAGFDGQFLNDVHYLHVTSGPGILLEESSAGNVHVSGFVPMSAAHQSAEVSDVSKASPGSPQSRIALVSDR
jgi:hypothetical protein